MIGSVSEARGLYAWENAISPGPGGRAYDSLKQTILMMYRGERGIGDVQFEIKKVNDYFSDYVSEKEASGKPRDLFYKELEEYAAAVNQLVAFDLRRDGVPGPHGRLTVTNGRLSFRDPGARVSLGPGVQPRAGKGAESAGFGSDSAPLLYSLMGAGVGYAVARKNRGMAAGVGALVGFLANQALRQ
jgi:hypothetical protein